MSPRIINLSTVQPAPLPAPYAASGEAAQHFAAQVAMLGAQMGSARLGVNLVALAPGMRAFPFHNHRANDELFYILAGNGRMRIGSGCHEVTAGDLIACPAGGPDSAHQLINSGTQELRYLAIGSNHSPDIIEFPDNGTYKAVDHAAPDGAPYFEAIGRLCDSRDYWQDSTPAA